MAGEAGRWQHQGVALSLPASTLPGLPVAETVYLDAGLGPSSDATRERRIDRGLACADGAGGIEGAIPAAQPECGVGERRLERTPQAAAFQRSRPGAG